MQNYSVKYYKRFTKTVFGLWKKYYKTFLHTKNSFAE